MRRILPFLVLVVAAFAILGAKKDPKMGSAHRLPEKNGWIFVQLEGKPAAIGYQHGYLLKTEIEEAFAAVQLDLTHDNTHDWNFFRTAAERDFWPKVEAEYRQEIQGMVDGLRARGSKLDLWDMVAYNAWLELSPYYVAWRDSLPQKAPAEHCSGFVATGSYTSDHRPVIAHNNWSGYLDGAHWKVIFDIRPAAGYRILMDGMPGLIHSGDDFGMNSAGIAITETTITKFSGFDVNGIPEFVRARKAMQYSASIDDFDRIMRQGNNGGYANNWLVADRKTGEVASLELGLKNVNLRRTRDGYFVGTNFPVNPKLMREETAFNPDDKSASSTARRIRAEHLVEQNKGHIDLAFGQRYLADHVDSFTDKEDPNERTLCGHIDLSPRGSLPWQPPFGAAGTVQAKVADAAMLDRLALSAAFGHPCGLRFQAAKHVEEHADEQWQKSLLRDLPSRPWTTFAAAGR